MEEIYTKARAKINLSLEILGKRDDGYHNIESVFQKINLYDEIYIKKNYTNTCEISTNIEELNNKENIIYKAYIVLKEKYDSITGVSVKINKKIPMQAGLAGGSTDCASFILGMNKLFKLNLSKDEIESIGSKLGADVVPCLYNRALIAKGIGEKITEIDTNFKYYIVIIKPNMSCNTKEMYQKIDLQNKILYYNKSSVIAEALEKHDLNKICNNLYNSFEDVVSPKEIMQNIKTELIKYGAINSLMTGSGSAIYGIFKNKEEAKNAYNILKENYLVYICSSLNRE